MLTIVVHERCGDDGHLDRWGIRSPVPAPSIESALNLMQITDPDDRLFLLDEVKTVSRVITGELQKELQEKLG